MCAFSWYVKDLIIIMHGIESFKTYDFYRGHPVVYYYTIITIIYPSTPLINTVINTLKRATSFGRSLDHLQAHYKESQSKLS